MPKEPFERWFTKEETTGIIQGFIQCLNCKHYNSENPVGVHQCKAFEDIPEDIFYNRKKHNKRIKGQKGNFVLKYK